MAIRQAQSSRTAESPPIRLIPTLAPPTPEELARRRRLFERAREIREAIGPIGIRTDDLIHEARRESGR